MAQVLRVVAVLGIVTAIAGCPFAPDPAPCLENGNCPDRLLCVAGFCGGPALGEGEGEGEGENCLELDVLVVNQSSDLDILQQRDCARIGTLEIVNFFAADVGGLAPLLSVGDSLIVHNSPSLQSLDGLENVATIGGDLVIESNTALTDVDALLNVVVGGDLTIVSNVALASCDAVALANAIEANGLGGTATVGSNRFDSCF